MSRRYDVAVIGGGANGLVAALELARAGKRVVVLEREDALGGQARTIDIAPGFRAPITVDAGWVSPAVARLVGAPGNAWAEPEIGVSVAHDGGFTSLPCDPRAADAAIRKLSSRDAGRWPTLIARLNKLAGFLGTLYQTPAPDVGATSLSELASLVGVGRKFRALGRADMTELLRVMPMPLNDLLDDELESAPLKAAVAAGGIRDLRQGPRSGGTTFNLLHYMIGAPAGSARARGWWKSGPDGFAELARAQAVKAGVMIQTGAPVKEIRVKDDVVSGVVLENGDEIEAPVVVSTLDPSRTLLGLVDPVWLDPDVMLEVRNIKFRGTTAVVLYALDRLPSAPGLTPEALSSIVSLSSDMDVMERAYDASKYGQVSSDPHIELSVPSLRWSTLAPQSKHVMVAHARYAPHRPKDGAWNDQKKHAFGDTVTASITRAIPGFDELVVQGTVLTPPDLEQQFGVTEGALTHGELTLDQILFMRPIAGYGRHAMPLQGLYLGGAGAHPGPGVTGGAGWLAARAVLSSRST